MASNGKPDYLADGTFNWSDGVDSSLVTTIKSELNPKGLGRNQLAWLYNATVRGGGILQRTGWQPIFKLADSGHWQGGFIYQPDSANPYLICVISGHVYRALLEAPYTINDLSALFGLVNPDTERCWFAQGENYLVIQAGDYYTNPTADPTGYLGGPSPTLPLFWDGTTLRRSIGIQDLTPAGMLPNINEIPAATAMVYYGQRLWYAQARSRSAGDIVGGTSGTAANHFRDAILNVTENPLCFGGDGFSVPTSAGNIRALAFNANLNATLGEGTLLTFTRKQIFALQVPTTRTDWIAADANNQPIQTVVQLVNGAVNDWSIVAENGDLFYQSLEPGIRSLITAVRNFQQWGNTPISQNELRAVQVNDRALMHFASGIEFDNRLWQLWLPERSADGVNVIFKAVLPLDFDVVSNLGETAPPVWEGAYSGLDHLQLLTGDFGGRDRAFTVMLSALDNSINVWELTRDSRTENGDNRLTWAFETPAFTWATHGLEFRLKHLQGGEMWVDKIFGTVNMDVYFREDADPCWRLWFSTEMCAARNCEETDPVTECYPPEIFREGYRFPVVFPNPQATCDSMGVRPNTVGYQFQVKVVIKGWCRIRGIILYALMKDKAQFEGVACPTSTPQGMAKLPTPFA